MVGDNRVADIAGAAAVGIPGLLVRRNADGEWGLGHALRVILGQVPAAGA